MAILALATEFQKPFSGNYAISQSWGVPGGLKSNSSLIHLGVDYALHKGTKITAAGNGKVVLAGWSDAHGNHVVVQHLLPDLTVKYTLYGHLDSLGVKAGANVFMGDLLGFSGNSGASDGYHLHFEVSGVNKFSNSGIYGKSYDTATEFKTSSTVTIDPVKFLNSHSVSGTQYGSYSSDTIWGLSTGQVTRAGGGNDIVYGNAGNDTIYGDAGDDIIYGGIGNDMIFGGTGNDIISGDGGKDIISTGSGYDLIVFNALSDSRPGSTNRDVITEFVRGLDKLSLSAIDANPFVSGDQAFSWIGNKAFSGQPGQLTLHGYFLEADVNGDKVTDFQVELVGITSLSASDFIL